MNRNTADHHRTHELRTDSTLHVVGVISNSARYQSRYRLYWDWVRKMEQTPNVRVHTVETAFGDRCHQVTDPHFLDVPRNPSHLQLRSHTEIWQKEAMINLAVRDLLPRDWRYVAWVDCDVEFRDPRWALETIHALQHFKIVQPWRHALDLGPRGEVMKVFDSFGYCQQEGLRRGQEPSAYYHASWGHPGFAWACTRDFWEATQGLLDFAILGSGDRHMAFGCTGDGPASVNRDLSGGYRRGVLDWARRAHRACHGQVGYVDGRLEHNYHGKKRDRQYQSRWKILIEHGFDPEKHLTRDHQGLIRLIHHPKLEHSIHRYNRNRHEDDIST